jgi:hypothetical protein
MRHGGSSAFEAPDGRLVYYAKGDRFPKSILKVPVVGGGNQSPGRAKLHNCAVTAKGIYYLALRGDAQLGIASLEFLDARSRSVSIEFFDFATGRYRRCTRWKSPTGSASRSRPTNAGSSMLR